MVAWVSGRQRQAALVLGGGKESQVAPPPPRYPRKHQGRTWRHICIRQGKGRKCFWQPKGQSVALSVCLPPQVALKMCQPGPCGLCVTRRPSCQGWGRNQFGLRLSPELRTAGVPVLGRSSFTHWLIRSCHTHRLLSPWMSSLDVLPRASLWDFPVLFILTRKRKCGETK